jgi:hypothetical protein
MFLEVKMYATSIQKKFQFETQYITGYIKKIKFNPQKKISSEPGSQIDALHPAALYIYRGQNLCVATSSSPPRCIFLYAFVNLKLSEIL